MSFICRAYVLRGLEKLVKTNTHARTYIQTIWHLTCNFQLHSSSSSSTSSTTGLIKIELMYCADSVWLLDFSYLCHLHSVSFPMWWIPLVTVWMFVYVYTRESECSKSLRENHSFDYYCFFLLHLVRKKVRKICQHDIHFDSTNSSSVTGHKSRICFIAIIHNLNSSNRIHIFSAALAWVYPPLLDIYGI